MENAFAPPTGWGRIDRYLYPYFQQDMAEGRLSLHEATDLLSDFLLYPSLCVKDP